MALAGLMTLASCTFEASDNGALDGYWQLTQTDTLSNGRSADMRESGFFWAVQHRLLEVRNTRQGMLPVFFRFELRDGLLMLSHPVGDLRAIGDSTITDVATLRPYGITRLSDTLRVLRLDSDHMTLQAQTVRMHFRKY